jgi:hypothetical protein
MQAAALQESGANKQHENLPKHTAPSTANCALIISLYAATRPPPPPIFLLSQGRACTLEAQF